ncbi:hypothetical protein E4631_23455 [Hymenobacter sp. UV11]|uniref:hypothetical protein n=1 Tax=Hymenobacter sp. UV11 TaxID=1849735 RepID=UPI00105DDE4B|nr:hypothetical protein [Hymenobacter sp. UV11]TDN39879.1 hypothetical protein A8B98_16615 [Hymenobacter sp. UV11]TFZ63264.1 hypothetical protein E4631_23455 [Hymenobacter sp. UV11]
MITPAPAPQQPQISPLDWVGDPGQCPKFVGFPTRTGLPADLIWSGKGEVPAIGARVHIYMNSYGPAEVKAYFHADGYLGVICQPDQMPARFVGHGVTQGHFFGVELEPRKVEPQSVSVCEAREKAARQHYGSQQRQARAAFPKASQKALRESYCAPALQMLEWAIEATATARRAAELAEAEQGLIQAEEANGNDPGINRSDDWIPDYPPQEGDELPDDNQDSEEHPEHPQDEQRD